MEYLPLIAMISTFVILLLLNVPIAFSIGLSTLAALAAIGGRPSFVTIAHQVATGIDSFALLAIPFFILSGMLMGRGGLARRLIDFAATIVGRFQGGLAYVNVVTCMLFGSISGSAVAAVSSIGGFMIPVMNSKGYHRDFNAAVTITASTTGLLIPPSNIMIVYSLAAGGLSVAALFLAGFLPGILMGLGLMFVCWIVARKKGYGEGEKSSLKDFFIKFKRAFLSLLLVFIVLGGIVGGIFTATEASAVAVFYAFLLTVVLYKEVKLKDLPGIMLECGITTAVVMLLIGTSVAMSWVLAYENIPQSISAFLVSLTDNKYIIFMIINLILLIVGTFMDMTPAVLIFTPIFLPVVLKLGMHPIHFGIMMILNLCIGICTPPVGTCLFVGCSIAKTTISKVTRPLLPFFMAMIVVLFLVTYLPKISLVVPQAFGYK
ncbi:MAG TPA: TRAP transporter large permease [archaeon]|nr:TRAP transporter large permease [archaeon]